MFRRSSLGRVLAASSGAKLLDCSCGDSSIFEKKRAVTSFLSSLSPLLLPPPPPHWKLSLKVGRDSAGTDGTSLPSSSQQLGQTLIELTRTDERTRPERKWADTAAQRCKKKSHNFGGSH